MAESQTGTYTEEELSYTMSRMLYTFEKQTDCGLLSKFAIIYYYQTLSHGEDVGYHCYKLWRSIMKYKNTHTEVQLFYDFFNQIYEPEALTFYLKVH